MTERDQSIMAVYDLHVGTLYRYVHRRCRDHALAEDIIQETFITAVSKVADPSTITIAWLQTVARNRLFDVLRRNVRYEEKLRLVANSLAGPEGVDPVERLRVEQALEALPVHYRLVLTLHYLNAMTVTEVAAELERTPKSVEGLLTRARRALSEQLEQSESIDLPGGES